MYPSPLMPEGLICTSVTSNDQNRYFLYICTSVTSKSESILSIKFYYVVASYALWACLGRRLLLRAQTRVSPESYPSPVPSNLNVKLPQARQGHRTRQFTTKPLATIAAH